jgi:hypothetical protein
MMANKTLHFIPRVCHDLGWFNEFGDGVVDNMVYVV